MAANGVRWVNKGTLEKSQETKKETVNTEQSKGKNGSNKKLAGD